MRQNKSWFTFVELIVVLVIIAILATIGFTVYESYLGTWRDTKRIVTLQGIHQSLSTFSTLSKLPIPENKVSLEASSKVFAYQWFITNEMANLIWYKWDIFDTEYETYPTYSLNSNRKDFQLLNFVEDNASLQSFVSQTHAFVDYETVFPITIWKPLWILLDSQTSAPIQTIDSYLSAWKYDIVTGTWTFLAFKSSNDFYEVNSTNILSIIPNQSCKRILEMWKSTGDGVYTISPNWVTQIQVYCDMRTDGGGWSILVNNDNSDDEFISDTTNKCYPRLSWFAWHACGTLKAWSDFVVAASDLEFSEFVWWVYEGSFKNLKTYRYLEWNSIQRIPATTPYIIPPASSDIKKLDRFQNLNLIYCGSSSSVSTGYIKTDAPNNTFPHNPVTTIWSSTTWWKISFTDARANGWSSNSYGFDDFQDGLSCWDTFSDKAYQGFSSYIMVR